MGDPKNVDFIPGHQLSYATTRIQLLNDNKILGYGTGFVLKFGTDYGLITNWHVVAGIHPITGMPLSKSGNMPDVIKFHVTVVRNEQRKDEKVATHMYFKPMELRLHNGDQNIWVESMQNGNRNDVALIILNDLVEELSSPGAFLAHIEGGKVTLKRGIKLDNVKRADGSVSVDSVSYLYPSVGKDVFILGYPLGIELSGIFPIWKRGSIASEPQADVESGGHTYKNIIYVDALTKSGMSGAPVVALTKTGDFLFGDDGATIAVEKEDVMFVGVYAGREGVTQEEYEFSIGRIWKAQTVAELFLSSHKKRVDLLAKSASSPD